ncbi:MAG: helix-turn-helix transcriptional regulator [Phascolarctobacterium sp.]|nr:helix-turn-helix transcriptional regulator [Phascolarctobacterium sp.]
MNLRYARKIAGLTQKEVADKIGIDRRTLSTWELGHKPINDYYLHRLAIVLKCPVAYLLGEKNMTIQEHIQLESNHSTLEDIEIIKTFGVLSHENRVALLYAARGFLECQKAQAEEEDEDYEDEYENEFYSAEC